VASLAEWVVGPIHYRVIVTGEPVDDTFIDAFVDDRNLGGQAPDFKSGVKPHPVRRRAQPGADSGRAWPSMYCLMIDRGAPGREAAEYDGDYRCPRMRGRAQAPVYSGRTA
jgi:hypothetical protein